MKIAVCYLLCLSSTFGLHRFSELKKHGSLRRETRAAPAWVAKLGSGLKEITTPIASDLYTDIKNFFTFTQHHTHVANNLKRPITILLIHPDKRYEKWRIQPGKTRGSPTERGQFTVVLLDGNDDDIVEQKVVYSDTSLMATRDGPNEILVRTVYGELWTPDPSGTK